jgi:hypothetical protein
MIRNEPDLPGVVWFDVVGTLIIYKHADAYVHSPVRGYERGYGTGYPTGYGYIVFTYWNKSANYSFEDGFLER